MKVSGGPIRKIMRKFPHLAIIFLLLGCVEYSYNGPSWSFNMPGLPGAVFVLCIVAFVVAFKIFNAAEAICRSKGLITRRIFYKYDVLLPIGIIASMIRFNLYSNDKIETLMGETVSRWSLRWGGDWSDVFIPSLVGLVLMLRVLALLREISTTAENSTQKPR